MAYALHVYIINPEDEEILVEHIFYGDSKDAAEFVKQEHLGSCAYFKAAEEEGRTDEKMLEIDDDERPSV